MPHHDVVLPDLGFEDEPIVLCQWLVKRGGRVARGDPLLEVLAASAVVDLPAPRDGVLREVLVAEDERVRPGQRLGVIAWDDR